MLNMTLIDTICHVDKQGVPRLQIAETLNISRNTVQKYAEMDDFNTTNPEVKAKVSILDPYNQSSIRFLLKIRNNRLSKGTQFHAFMRYLLYVANRFEGAFFVMSFLYSNMAYFEVFGGVT